MMKLTSITGLLGLSAVLLSSHLPAAAQNCRPLSLLGGEGCLLYTSDAADE